MQKNIFKTLGIFTLVLLVMSMTGAASVCSPHGHNQMYGHNHRWNSLSDNGQSDNDGSCNCGNDDSGNSGSDGSCNCGSEGSNSLVTMVKAVMMVLVVTAVTPVRVTA